MKRKPKTPKLPQTEFEWSVYRCKLDCKVGREALEKTGEIHLDYALFCLLGAVAELAQALELLKEGEK